MGYTLELQDRATKVWKSLAIDPRLASLTVGEKGIVWLSSGPRHASVVHFQCTRAIVANEDLRGHARQLLTAQARQAASRKKCKGVRVDEAVRH